MPLEELIRSKTAELGFERFGITSAEPIPENEERFQKWLAGGYQGQMDYMAKEPSRRQDPREVLPGAKSIIVVAMNYNPVSPSPQPPPIKGGGNSLATLKIPSPLWGEGRGEGVTLTGRIARYAWGRDYHKVLDKKLKQLENYLHEIALGPIQSKRYVDTGPVLEKAYAERAGIGFIGKNTLLISKGLGSWLFLGEILTTLELKKVPAFFLLQDESGKKEAGTFLGSCGTCTRCLDACPTDAFIAPYQLDARKCIAYLTIEHRGPIPEELHEKMGDWIFGCDICQEVCPYNRKAPVTKELSFLPSPSMGEGRGGGGRLSLDNVLSIQSDEEYLKRFQGTPLMRAKRAGLQRNAAIAAGNQGLVQ